MTVKRKTGTREWADASYNIGKGCSHGCLYCYAKATSKLSNEDWLKESIKSKLPKIPKSNDYVMFPTQHDISEYYLDTAGTAIAGLLSAGNNVLIVSKPHFKCIKEICDTFIDYKDRILFRFTIGSFNDYILKLWEPGAPNFMERVLSLQFAFNHGFKTSISMEPMLEDVETTLKIFKMLELFVTDKIWIGKMNKIAERVRKSSPIIEAACKKIEEEQSDKNILWLVDQLKNHPKIEWKDSIKEVIEFQKKLDDKEKYDRETDLFA